MTVTAYLALLARANCQRDVMNCINGNLAQVACGARTRRSLLRKSIARLDVFSTAEGVRGACFVASKLEGLNA